jgi:hypothetical protein
MELMSYVLFYVYVECVCMYELTIVVANDCSITRKGCLCHYVAYASVITCIPMVVMKGVDFDSQLGFCSLLDIAHCETCNRNPCIQYITKICMYPLYHFHFWYS